ncbi:MAG TPA: hypothetical protein VE402_07395, partial [Candidatus Angelobacter sp.]|nr:hypothetical protein [Candidatus Angelobacter sp.]
MKRVLTFAVLLLFAVPVYAQTVRSDFWVTDGYVNDVKESNGTVYIGGAFTRVGPASGCAVPISTTTGLPVANFPKVAGSVAAIAPDGAGGWYLGGSFVSVGGVARANLAHLASDLSVTSWDPAPDDRVECLAVTGGTVYVGGAFQNIGGQARAYAGAVDASTGLATSWNPDADSDVQTIALSGGTAYLGGSFNSLGGGATTRLYIAAVSASTGVPTS